MSLSQLKERSNLKVQKTFQRKDLTFSEIHSVDTPNGRFYSTPLGVFPSVTTILSSGQEKGYLTEWRERVGEEEAAKVTKEATDRGTAVHNMIEKYLLGKEVSLVNPILRGHFLQIKKHLDSLECIYANEIPLYSKHLKVAGRCDCVAMINNEIHIVDFKTSKHQKTFEEIESSKMQCAAYTFMINEMFGLKVSKFSILLSNLYENKCDFYHGESKQYIKEFWELRKKWKNTISQSS